jgi:hypothetical protein
MNLQGRHHLFAAATVSVLLLPGCGGSSSTSSATTGPHTTTTAPPTSTVATTAATSASTSGTVGLSSGGVTATMHPANHHPVVERPWPIGFTVTNHGHPARASVAYEYLFGGQVVAHRSHYLFTGHFSDVFKWPASAVGYPLTFRAVIVSGEVTLNLDYQVQVVK